MPKIWSFPGVSRPRPLILDPSLASGRSRVNHRGPANPLGLDVIVAALALAACTSAGSHKGDDGERNDKVGEHSKKSANASPKTPKRSEEDWEALYRKYKGQLEELRAGDKKAEDELETGFRDIANSAPDPHLRANACIAAASIWDQRKDYASAISYYKQAIALVPKEPSPYALMALAQAAQKDYRAAGKTQEEVVRRDPDDLQAWLILGELKVKAKQKKEAAMAYAAYETRRKGLLDGLTLKKQGQYELSEKERVECVYALEAAPDAGTSLALIYALQSDPSAPVRSALIDLFARQRFAGFVKPLQEWLPQEKDSKLKAQIRETIALIQAQPVQTRPEAGDIAVPLRVEDKGAKPGESAKKNPGGTTSPKKLKASKKASPGPGQQPEQKRK